MGKRVDKPKAGKTAAAATRSKTSSAAKARKPAPAARAASSKPAAAKPAGKAVAKVAAKTAPAKPASKQVPATTAARSMTKAAQKQSDKKLVDRAKASAIVLPADYHPSEDEPFMNEYQRLYFRQKLLNWKEEIIRQTKETLEGLHEDSVQHADLADRATSETDRALELRARDRQRKLISKIDAALARIEDGTYGYCEETGEPIGLKRLDARPIATLSLEAQERHERRERVYRED
jgi:DnaK suppressor protein